MPATLAQTLSAPLGVISALHILTLTLHFTAMSLLVGGVIIVLWGKLSDRWNHPVVQQWVGLFPSIMAGTVTLGVAPFLFLQLVYPKPVYSAAIVSAGWWLLIIPVVITVYYLFYRASLSEVGDGRRAAWLTAALVGLLYVSLVYSAVFSLAEQPAAQRALYAQDPSGWTFNPAWSGYLLRWLHMLSGTLCVGGFALVVSARGDAQTLRSGKRIFLGAMIVAAIVGGAYTMTLGDALKPFMRSPGIWALTVGVVLALVAIYLLFKARLRLAGGALFGSLLAMVTTRHVLREVRLRGSFDAGALAVTPQWGMVALFGLCLLIGAGVMAYMIRLWRRHATAI